MVHESAVLRFGAFELDGRRGELRRNGMLIRLAPQPLQVLRLLAGRAGEVVTREEIRRELWGGYVQGDLDRNLNVCIAQIRAALGDDAESARFLQTVPRQGYRFVAEVKRLNEALPAQPASRWPVAWIAAGMVLVAGILWITRGTGPRGPGARAMVAVLPFESLAGDEAQTMFRDGLADTLTTQLGGAQPQRLGVIARRSVQALAARTPGIAAVAAQLNVRYVIEGSVRSIERGLRVSARLVDARDQTQLWASSMEQGEAATADFEQQAARAIAAGVLRTLAPGHPSQARQDGGRCGAAWESLRAGRMLEMKGGRSNLERAVEFFRQAVDQEPRCVEAGAALSDALLHLARSGGGEAYWRPAREAAEWVLSKEPENAEARNVRANIRFWRDWNWVGAEQDFLYSLKLNPSAAVTQHDYAWFQMAMGRTQDALESLRRSIELDPLSSRISIDAGWLYLQAHRYDDAAREARRTLLLEPESKEAQACLARALLYAGDERGAVQAMTRYLPAAQAGRLQGLPAGRAVRELQQRLVLSPGDPFTRATRLAFLGQKEAALAALGEAIEKRGPSVVMLRSDPAFLRYQADAEFRRLLEKLKLP